MRLSDEQVALGEAARSFLQKLAPLEQLDGVERGLRPSTTDDRWRALRELGFPGLPLSGDIGGGEGSALDMAVLSAELGGSLCPDPIGATWDAVSVLVAAGGDPILADVAAGLARPVLALAGPAGSWTAEGVRARSSNGSLTGSVPYVEGADTATHLLVAAGSDPEPCLFLVERDAPGVHIAPMDAIVGRWWWKIDLKDATGTPLGAGWDAVHAALPAVWARLAAWCAGAAERLIADTAAYARQRVQFGVPIGSFQAVQHNLASATIAAKEAWNLARASAEAVDSLAHDRMLWAASAAVRSEDAFVEVARRCHQTWGGIGFCTESSVHHFSRRAMAAQQSRGGRSQRLDMVADLLASSRNANGSHGGVTERQRGDSLDGFRKEVRAFVRDHFDPKIPEQGSFPQGDTPEKRAFLQLLAARGWLGLAWPESYGGRGLDPRFQLVLQQELEYSRLPTASIEVGMVGPTLLRHGSDELRAEFLPPITRGELNVALGYSEPEAGSDLANLSLRADRDGNDYVLNGQKMYTSGAHFADVIWLACRTDPTAAAHRGISILIVDTDTDGISVSALKTMGTHRTNVVFFDDVRVPASRLVGEENQGWRYIMEALDLERLTGFPTGGFLRDLDELVAWCDDAQRWDDPVTRELVASVGVATMAAISHFEEALDVLASGEIPTEEATMLKIAVTEARQDQADRILRYLGPVGLLRSGPDAVLGGHFEEVWRDEIITTIAGGANEIQRNIIAQRVLGLPRG